MNFNTRMNELSNEFDDDRYKKYVERSLKNMKDDKRKRLFLEFFSKEISYVPEEYIDFEMCKRALRESIIKNFQYVPEDIQNTEEFFIFFTNLLDEHAGKMSILVNRAIQTHVMHYVKNDSLKLWLEMNDYGN